MSRTAGPAGDRYPPLHQLDSTGTGPDVGWACEHAQTARRFQGGTDIEKCSQDKAAALRPKLGRPIEVGTLLYDLVVAWLHTRFRTAHSHGPITGNGFPGDGRGEVLQRSSVLWSNRRQQTS